MHADLFETRKLTLMWLWDACSEIYPGSQGKRYSYLLPTSCPKFVGIQLENLMLQLTSLTTKKIQLYGREDLKATFICISVTNKNTTSQEACKVVRSLKELLQRHWLYEQNRYSLLTNSTLIFNRRYNQHNHHHRLFHGSGLLACSGSESFWNL
jgi:hypothetical protein